MLLNPISYQQQQQNEKIPPNRQKTRPKTEKSCSVIFKVVSTKINIKEICIHILFKMWIIVSFIQIRPLPSVVTPMGNLMDAFWAAGEYPMNQDWWTGFDIFDISKSIKYIWIYQIYLSICNISKYIKLFQNILNLSISNISNVSNSVKKSSMFLNLSDVFKSYQIHIENEFPVCWFHAIPCLVHHRFPAARLKWINL